MTIFTCRVCGQALFQEPLLHYENLPKAAQQFPDGASLERDGGVDLTVCQCSGCGLVQLPGEPVPYYREVIRSAAYSDVMRDLKTRQFAAFVEKHSLHGKKIIEIGCGNGEFLSLLQGMDVLAYGLEHSESSVARCTSAGLRVFRGYVDSNAAELENGPFDAFLLLMFLEHMSDPNSALKGIHKNLADGAVGLVEVPNFDMVLRNKLFSEFVSDHLLYFTAKTLETTLRLNGFEVVECSELRDEYVISAVVRKRAKLDVSDFANYQQKIQVELDSFLARFGDKRVAIWGAGHQALAIVALTKIARRIRYVVDSAPFKQGRFTPATHIPVVPPDTLRSDPVDAVIIMAASYSDEVAAIVRQQFDRRLQVAVLRDFGLEIVGLENRLHEGAKQLAPDDLEHVLDHTRDLWNEVRGERLFVTGGTGFFGKWLLETFCWANSRISLGAKAVVLTRDPDRFAHRCPSLAANDAVELCKGDVRSFEFPSGDFHLVVHAATEASARLKADDPSLMIDTIIGGTVRVLQFARGCGARKLLFTSSGAVYGPQPQQVMNVDESYDGGPKTLDRRSSYAEAKRLAELLCAVHSPSGGFEAKIARCFTFVGPHLPLDRHFAIGNFLRDALAGRQIDVSGDGTPMRSYLYAADLAVWLWTILFRGQSLRAYNVGSPEGVSIADLASTVAEVVGTSKGVRIAKVPCSGAPVARYVPSVNRAQTELGLRVAFDLKESIRRTAAWYA